MAKTRTLTALAVTALLTITGCSAAAPSASPKPSATAGAPTASAAAPSSGATAGATATATAAPTAAATATPVSGGTVTEVTVWVPTSGENKIDEAFVAKWNAANTDIQIKYVALNSDTSTNDQVLALRTGAGPDIFTGPAPAQIINPGFAMPLNGKFSADFEKAYTGYLDGKFDYVVGGKFYEVPQRLNGTRLLINRDLFKAAGLDPAKPPTTFSEVIAAAAAITKSAAGKAWGFGLPLAFDGVFQNHIEPLAMATNAGLTRVALFDKAKQAFATDAYVPLINLYRKLIADGSMYPGVGTLDRDQLRAAFSQGKVGMYVGSSVELGVLNNQLKSAIDWIPVRLPVEDGKTFVRSSGTVSGGPFVNAATTHPEATLKVYEAWMGYDRICEILKAGIIVPLRNDVGACAPTGIRGYAEFFPTADSGDVPDAIAPANSLTVPGAPYEQVLAEQILGTGDPGPAMAEVGARYTKAYLDAIAAGTIKQDDYK